MYGDLGFSSVSSVLYPSTTITTPASRPQPDPSLLNQSAADCVRVTSGSDHLHDFTTTSRDCNANTVRASTGPSDSHFDSLQDLLERAGYKETRVVTPDRHGLAKMAARNSAASQHNVTSDDVVTDPEPPSPTASISPAADHLRKAVRNTTYAGGSKSLPSRGIKPTATGLNQAAPPVPLSSWISNLWSFGPGAIAGTPSGHDDAKSNGGAINGASDNDATCNAHNDNSSFTATKQQDDLNTGAQQSNAPCRPKAQRTASQNQVWNASVAYRSAKSRTAPIRSKAAKVLANDACNSDDATAEWNAMIASGTTKKRPGLVDAFSSPTKPVASSSRRPACATSDTTNETVGHDSPTQQRRWRQERAAWRESLGDLQAMMDASRQRREASAASQNSVQPIDEATASHESRVIVPQVSDATAMAKLLSGPALPFLSMDPAVAPRNATCTRPAHLSMRRMKSVEVLSKIMRDRRAPAPSSADGAAGDLASSYSSSSSTAVESLTSSSSDVTVNGESGRISPTSKRSTPPRLTLSSPRGITSPKDLELAGVEFEPLSWSPQTSIIITNRKVARKPRLTKLRHTATSGDLRGQRLQDEEECLKAPRGRNKSRSRSGSKSSVEANTDPDRARSAVSTLRNSIGSLSRSAQIQRLRQTPRICDEMILEDASRRKETPRSDSSERKPFAHISAAKQGCDDDDVFRPSYASVKKTVSVARITKTSKIMRLIDDVENMPSIASMISNSHTSSSGTSHDSITSNRRRGAKPVTGIDQPSSASQDRPNMSGARPIRASPRASAHATSDEDLATPLSSSLSKTSKERMIKITRVLGNSKQHQQ
ncbi:hypothetical protein BCV70DRAFT_201036 [Testicularia cyperi]|uniref:Uncharacterized protein n=1 Tax=Testicularia cyperi TaxID=1882483 RepID=A0A317XN19_9BASI|nr:hypothetical protein BCV70DRAFT_201036 [Testicularia cyperi]